MTASRTSPCPDCGGPVEDHRVSLYKSSRIAQEHRLIPSCQACADAEFQASHAAPSPADGHERTVLARLKQSGLPKRLWDLRIEDLDDDLDPRLIAALHTWARDGGGLYLYGQVGRGKTYMAAAATRAAVERRPVTWAPVPALVTRSKLAFGDDERTKALQALLRPGALVLDDLGQENPSATVRELLHTAIDQRYAHGVPLLITSNLLLSELGDRYDLWLPSRLVEYCRLWRIEGDDRRLTERTHASRP